MSEYNRKTWKDGDVLDADALNHMEAGISEAKKESEQAALDASRVRADAAAGLFMGPQGPKGDTGAGFRVLGYYATVSALRAAVPSANIGDAYGVGTSEPYNIYIFDGATLNWVNNGPLQGAKGDTGPQGPKGDKGDTPTLEEIGAAAAGHTHTAADVGATPYIDANSASYDMDIIIKDKSLNGVFFRTGNATLGTPYAKGVTTLTSANILNVSSSADYGAQFAFPSGGPSATPMFWRTLRSGVISEWSTGFLPLAGGTIGGNLTINRAGESTSAFRVENGHGAANFTISSSGNIGIYDPIGGKWLLMFTPELNRLALPINPAPDQYSVRQIKAGTTDLVDGTTTLATGAIYVYYEE